MGTWLAGGSATCVAILFPVVEQEAQDAVLAASLHLGLLPGGCPARPQREVRLKTWAQRQVTVPVFVGAGWVNVPVDDFDAHGAHNAPFLDFTENFVVAFVDALDAAVGGRLKPNLAAVVGGSLGGNLGLRLGRRNAPWLSKVVAWDAGSVWESLADGADLTKHTAVRTAFEQAGGGNSSAQWGTNPYPTTDLASPFYDEPDDKRWEFFRTIAGHPRPRQSSPKPSLTCVVRRQLLRRSPAAV